MNRDTLANFLLGLGLGVGLGMLFAPKSGDETRDQLLATAKTKADEGREFLKKQTADLKDNAGDLLSKGRDAISRQKDTLNDAIAAGKQAYREKVEQSAQGETA